MKYDDFKKGEIPWSQGEFHIVNNFLSGLLGKPKDDWDTKEKIAGLNMFTPMGQIAKYMRSKYDQDKTLWKAHFIRYNNIIHFLQKYQKDLVERRLLLEQSSGFVMSTKLLTVLCQSLYTEEYFDEGGKKFSFSFQDVISGL